MKAQQKTELFQAIIAVAEAASELAVVQADDDAGGYERDCAYMGYSRATEQLEMALDAAFGADDEV